MLGIIARLAPDDRRGRPFHRPAVLGDGLAVALHLELLEVSWKTLQAIIVGQYGVGGQIEEADVPNTHETGERGQVGLPGRGAEMLIHLVSACQAAAEILPPYCN